MGVMAAASGKLAARHRPHGAAEKAERMDPNAAVAQIRAIEKRMEKRAEYVEEHQTDAAWDDYRRTDEANADDRELLVELYEALDAWIVRGGFLPDEWRKPITDAAVVTDLQAGVRAVERAARGDSNDDEIDALQEALELALTRWPEVEYKR